MLLHAWLLLPYTLVASALLLAGTVMTLCLRTQPIQNCGFVIAPERRHLPLRPRRLHQPRREWQEAA
jgi:hypothetical protein